MDVILVPPLVPDIPMTANYRPDFLARLGYLAISLPQNLSHTLTRARRG